MGKKRKLKEKAAKTFVSKMPYEDMFIAQDTLDVHEFGPMFHDDIRVVLENFILDSHKAKLTRIKIVTGKGRIVRPMAQKLLSKSPYVQEFRFAGYFTGQDGAIEILLKIFNKI